MESIKTFITSTRTVVELVKSIFLAFVVLTGVIVLAFATFLFAYSIPDTNLELTNVAKDTTFYAGTQRSNQHGSGRLAMLTTSELNDSTASITIEYTNPPALMGKTHLLKGKVSQLYQGDFYDSRAKVTYRHGSVKRGRLHLQLIFSYPPEDWQYSLEDRH